MLFTVTTLRAALRLAVPRLEVAPPAGEIFQPAGNESVSELNDDLLTLVNLN